MKKSFKITKRTLATAVMPALLSFGVMGTSFAAAVEGIKYDAGTLTPDSDGYIAVSAIMTAGGISSYLLKSDFTEFKEITEAELVDLSKDIILLGADISGFNEYKTATAGEISALDGRVSAAETGLTTAVTDITDLKSGKLDKSDFNEYKTATAGEISALNGRVSAGEAAIKTINEEVIPSINNDISDLQSNKLDKAEFNTYKGETSATLDTMASTVNSLTHLTAGFPEGETIKEYIDGADTNTTYMFDTAGRGTDEKENVVSHLTYTSKEKGETESVPTQIFTDTDTKYTLSQATSGNQTTISLKGNDGSEAQTATIAGDKGIKITGDDKKATIALDTDYLKGEIDTNTTYTVEEAAGTGNVVKTYTLKASDNSSTGTTIVDTDTTYTAGANVSINAGNQISAADSKITGIKQEHDDASGSNSYTIQYTTDTVKDGAVQTEEKSYVIIDRDTTYTAGTNVGINADNQVSAADSKITGITKAHDGASGSDSYTIQYTTDTVKDGAVQTEEKSYVITDRDTTYTAGENIQISSDNVISATDTNTHASVSDDGNGYVSVTKTSEATATAGPAYQVSMSDDAKTAIGNANTYLDSNGFSAGGGKVTVTKDGFAVQGGPSMTADGIDAGNQVISNVKDGKVEKGSKEAVTGGQLYDIQQQNSSQDDALKKLAHRDAQLERKIYRAGAHAAAIAALHPLDYDEDHKFTAAAGVGQYHGSSAMAVGAFYRPTENLMFSVGASLNENDSMVNAGMSYRFGTGSGNKTSPNNIHEMKRQINNLSEENRLLSAKLDSSESKLASADARIASSDAEIKELKTRLRQIEKLLKLK